MTFSTVFNFAVPGFICCIVVLMPVVHLPLPLVFPFYYYHWCNCLLLLALPCDSCSVYTLRTFRVHVLFVVLRNNSCELFCSYAAAMLYLLRHVHCSVPLFCAVIWAGEAV